MSAAIEGEQAKNHGIDDQRNQAISRKDEGPRAGDETARNASEIELKLQ